MSKAINSQLVCAEKLDDVRKLPKILLVEDSPIMQKVYQFYLKKWGYHVDLVKSGIEALAIFKNGYDLMLLNMQLPDMSGLAVVRLIRQYEKREHSLRPLTIIAFTVAKYILWQSNNSKMLTSCLEDSDGLAEWHTKALQAGCNDFYLKSFNVDRKIFFEYDAEFVKTGLELSPFKLPLKAGIIESSDRVFEGLFGLFNDSLPDGWGRLLLDRKLMRAGFNPVTLSPLDRLSFIGNSGMGALSYEPEHPNAVFGVPSDLHSANLGLSKSLMQVGGKTAYEDSESIEMFDQSISAVLAENRAKKLTASKGIF